MNAAVGECVECGGFCRAEEKRCSHCAIYAESLARRTKALRAFRVSPEVAAWVAEASRRSGFPEAQIFDDVLRAYIGLAPAPEWVKP